MTLVMLSGATFLVPFVILRMMFNMTPPVLPVVILATLLNEREVTLIFDRDSPPPRYFVPTRFLSFPLPWWFPTTRYL
ncbi:hypothetical protein BDR05DRAFT_955229 [Suillus weaverae]|nr:hypothetical protein BDR05DRAFT_955229 [Suillus weaverae]